MQKNAECGKDKIQKRQNIEKTKYRNDKLQKRKMKKRKCGKDKMQKRQNIEKTKYGNEKMWKRCVCVKYLFYTIIQYELEYIRVKKH